MKDLTYRKPDGTIGEKEGVTRTMLRDKLFCYEKMELTPEEFKETVDYVLGLNKLIKSLGNIYNLFLSDRKTH